MSILTTILYCKSNRDMRHLKACFISAFALMEYDSNGLFTSVPDYDIYSTLLAALDE
jgi:hypothetical protein